VDDIVDGLMLSEKAIGGCSWSSSAVLDEVVFHLVCIDNLSCKALPITASRGLRTRRVEVCRKLEGLIVRGSKVLVELHRKSGPRSTSNGRSHDIVLLDGKLWWGSKW
jgi:hypothetical protein